MTQNHGIYRLNSIALPNSYYVFYWIRRIMDHGIPLRRRLIFLDLFDCAVLIWRCHPSRGLAVPLVFETFLASLHCIAYAAHLQKLFAQRLMRNEPREMTADDGWLLWANLQKSLRTLVSCEEGGLLSLHRTHNKDQSRFLNPKKAAVRRTLIYQPPQVDLSSDYHLQFLHCCLVRISWRIQKVHQEIRMTASVTLTFVKHCYIFAVTFFLGEREYLWNIIFSACHILEGNRFTLM